MQMHQAEMYLHSIHELFPDIAAGKVEFHNHDGQFNDILILNDEFIFRFPRYSAGAAKLVIEVQLLEYLQGHISLPIPRPLYSSTGTGRVFMGYRMIPGEPLWREKLMAATDEHIQQRIADQLAGFLRELHNAPIDGVSKGLPVQDVPDEWLAMYRGIEQDLFPFMRPNAQARIRDHFESYLNDPLLHQHKICLRHGDFGPGNILYNPQVQQIGGVIDFESLGLGDPAVDIAAASTYGEAFVRRFSAVYPEIEGMLERARFYRGTYALQEALHGFRNNDREAFESGMAGYR